MMIKIVILVNTYQAVTVCQAQRNTFIHTAIIPTRLTRAPKNRKVRWLVWVTEPHVTQGFRSGGMWLQLVSPPPHSPLQIHQMQHKGHCLLRTPSSSPLLYLHQQ